MNMQKILAMPIVKELQAEKEVFWFNPLCRKMGEAENVSGLTAEDIKEAEERLQRFAPFIMKCFPETESRKGLIESELVPIPKMRERLNEKYKREIRGALLLKKDSHLAIAGSIKARGGIYEVLKHAEDLALREGLLAEGESYEKLASKECREFFGRYKVQVGSTGNLGLSIGIMSAAIGFEVIVHMSADARQWKKDLLRSHGVKVIEYASDYGEAVKNGRAQSEAEPASYFVDDENSKDLFLGYAVAAGRLERQLQDLGVKVDADHPLFVHIPCGVGGAPGGVAFGLKEIFKDHVHCFFIEPTQAPCMLLGMASEKNSAIAVSDIGLSGQTHADGLAVGRASGFVGAVMSPLLAGICTIKDARLYDYMRDLLETEDIFIEPSACAAFQPVLLWEESEEAQVYMRKHGLEDKMSRAHHIIWATGGRLVPEEIRREYENTYLE